jgi:hypothetical protein
MRRERGAWRVWPILVALLAAVTAWSEETVALPAPLRSHLRGEKFVAVSGVAALPADVRDGLQALWQSSNFEMAEPGTEFQATDVILKPNLPIRRLDLAGCSVDHCIIYYERGGIAHTYTVVLFRTKSPVRFEWGGAAPRDLVDLAQVKAAVLNGTVRGASKYW